MNIITRESAQTICKNGKTIAFTGPRPKKLEGYSSRDPYTAFVKDLKNTLIIYIKQGYSNFITGGAQGIDQLAFWAVCGLKKEGYNINNLVYVPYKGQELRWSEKGMFSQAEYNMMLEKADAVVYLKNKLDNLADISKALTERNHAMCDDSDLLIGFYDGDDFMVDTGGTAECLRYATSTAHEKIISRFN